MKNNPTKYLQSLGYGCLLWASVSLFAACSDESHEPDSVVNEPYKIDKKKKLYRLSKPKFITFVFRIVKQTKQGYEYEWQKN